MLTADGAQVQIIHAVADAKLMQSLVSSDRSHRSLPLRPLHSFQFLIAADFFLGLSQAVR